MPIYSKSNSYEAPALCELCLNQGVDAPATELSTDRWGNAFAVCTDHATALENAKPESIADNWRDGQ